MENRIQAAPVVPQHAPTKATTSANVSTSANASHEIKVPKSNIQVDAEGMQRNLDMAITKLNEQMQAKRPSGNRATPGEMPATYRTRQSVSTVRRVIVWSLPHDANKLSPNLSN